MKPAMAVAYGSWVRAHAEGAMPLGAHRAQLPGGWAVPGVGDQGSAGFRGGLSWAKAGQPHQGLGCPGRGPPRSCRMRAVALRTPVLPSSLL